MGTIQRLPEDVVNRIAAGEVVVRPANAVKELIENALDADASEIIVSIKGGGIGLIQIQDNGKGIHKEDLEIVCERFTTSKLRKFEDLQNMQTFGFRGEALCSVSHVAKVSITSKTKDQACAFQARYADGKLTGEIRASAGLDGTIITAEDLFYNCVSRRKAFRNVAEESNRVSDVVTRYAVHRPDVSFALRRGGGGGDFRTNGKGDRKQTISALMGRDTAQNLLDMELKDKNLHFSLSGVFSIPISACTAHAIQSKKTRGKTLFLFINNRIVNCNPLKHAIDTIFQLRDVVCPFMWIDLQIEPSRIDVNVHPTKENVLFLDQEDIIESIQNYLESLLWTTLESQMQPKSVAQEMASQRLLSDTQVSRIPTQSDHTPRTQKVADYKQIIEKKRRDHELVRTSASERRLEEFMVQSNGDANVEVDLIPVTPSQSDETQNELNGTQTKRVFEFDSLRFLKKEIVKGSSKSLREFMKNIIFVGCVDAEHVMVQHSTCLYLVNLRTLTKELFYQCVVFSFGNLGSFLLDEGGARVDELFLLEHPDETQETCDQVCEFLLSNTEMLADYFSIQFAMVSEEDSSSHLRLLSIPSLVTGFVPQLEGMPKFVSQLVREVDWDEEESCFRGISNCVAELFAMKNDHCDGELLSGFGTSQWKNVVQDILMPRLKTRLMPPESWKEGSTLVRLADLHDLYKVFERC